MRTASCKGIDTAAARGDAGRAGGLDRRRSRGGGLRPAASARMTVPQPRRLADEDAAAPRRSPRTRCAIVGDPVACVVAETAAQAKDAAEAVELDIEPLPAVTDAARRRRSPARRSSTTTRRAISALDFHYGDSRDGRRRPSPRPRTSRGCDLRQQPHRRQRRWSRARRSATTTPRPTATRCTSAARACSACAAASPRRARASTPDKVRVLTGNVGGSFGMKAPVYPEYVCLLHAARDARPPGEVDRRALRQLPLRPARPRPRRRRPSWRSTRTASSSPCASPATAISAPISSTSAPLMPTAQRACKNIARRLPHAADRGARPRCVFTNTTPVGAYRGAGRPEGNYYMERLIDTAAREMGIDRVELRRRNHITPERDALQGRRRARPTTAASSPRCSTRRWTLADWRRASTARKAESQARGKLRGRGIGDYLEVTAPPSKEMGGIRFEADGDVTIITGTLDYGQGHCDAVRPGAGRAARHPVRDASGCCRATATS